MGSCFSVRLKIESSRLDGKVTSASVPPSPRSPRSQAQILQQSENLKSFSFNVLKTATRNFRPDSVLGEGGFGSVFKGWIDEQSLAAAKPGTGTVIAVKRLNHEGIQGHQEWLAEINYLGQLYHQNLVKLIGYCLEDDHRLLVYEFMPRGSLENHLFRRSSYFQPLSWNLRIKVALGAAKGLAYLHSPEAKVIYRDFKSSNILIDSNYNAKLSDFGLAKDGPVDGKSHVSTRVMGTHGYAAPEYMATEIARGFEFSKGLSMALLQFMCSVTPLARAVRSRSLIVSSSRTVVTLPSSTTKTKVSPPDSTVLLGMSEEQLQQLAIDFGQQSYRGKQLHHLLYKRRVKEIQEFSQVPLAFRTELQEAGWVVGRSSVHSSVVAADGTIKLLIKLEDNRLVETVGIPVADDKGSVRLTACVSSQVGCPLRCSFCATGKGGFSRNLKGHEIVEQVLAIEEIFNNRVTNVVFMGMGEPMLNLKEVLAAHRCLNKDVQIGQRMMTISTVGVPNTIKKLASHKLQSTLALSLHAPNQKLREKIVPSAKAYPLEAIMKDCRDYFHETSRRVSFEYTLLAGVNDDVEHAKELAELLHQWGPGYHVNLIPFNPIEGTEYKRPYRKAINIFQSMLESRKITVSVRQTRGLDASAACGQLRNEFQKSPLVTPSIDDIQPEAEAEPEAAVAC